MKKFNNLYYSGLAWLFISTTSIAERSVDVINSPGTDVSDQLSVFDSLIKTAQQFMYYAAAPAIGGFIILKGFKRLSGAEREDDKEGAWRQIIIGSCIMGIVPLIQGLMTVVTKAGEG